MFSLSDYDYYLPEERIAQKPVVGRDQSKLLFMERYT
ncbi:MAG: S-adenosylmethionine:tRNA ribosyltransferase-isomerase, partial [Desulfobacteraceae bacterium]|nr:S-adenosylmethionine:tRNA ribosyltransferase-isomerase [Desulfobacteraceae bacterium]